ncbi:NAD(P)/FAD-dependent oxidoreductase [Myxococcus sp. MISCRS1]|uniref:dihydrolipoyl dehydrogenase family protein n=1 Tax=Myxococcus TaxID=32 RepID=UPI001CBB7BF7|nr:MULTISPECIES: NAD(P)/FAD-dependent oxidoreductase [unclassified Myxococcus]MBZ4414370.1 NAD(P)/FAD-dependent oxidoreductase [Myxococcus sp. XM-1-1-1]MCY0999341.1 NAD(P)/FAD-dependent oxidoreductase [Myxococcus sp. MISCRS1]BDT30658.1 NAD(P)/FAD-dependent oxidoreductase [Myxococcus sp. MH1]
MAEVFDVVVIGGGPTGENAGARAAAAGLSVALVEHELLGGECSYWACIPSKALLRPADALWLAKQVPGVRETLKGPLVASAVLEHRDAMVGYYKDDSQVKWAEGAKLKVVRGHGKLAGPRKVRVEAKDGGVRELEAKRAVVLATGSRPRIPDIPGLKEARPWDNREGTAAKQVPQRLLVLGGGVVAAELAQAWRSLGAEVTLVERGKALLSRFEPFVGEQVEHALREDGVKVVKGATVTNVSRPGGQGEVTVKLSTGEELRADALLVGMGRVPRTDELGLETVGLKPGETVQVDDQLRAKGVEGGWLYACGDVNGRNLLTHMGKYQARLVGDVIAGKKASAWADTKATPQVIFTHPQVASVGLTEVKAREKGLPVRTVQYDLGKVSGTSLLGEKLGGTAKLVVDEKRRVVLGATFTGPEVGEMLHAATIAVAGEVSLDTLWHAVPSFPTMSEVWLRLLEEYGL